MFNKKFKLYSYIVLSVVSLGITTINAKGFEDDTTINKEDNFKYSNKQKEFVEDVPNDLNNKEREKILKQEIQDLYKAKLTREANKAKEQQQEDTQSDCEKENLHKQSQELLSPFVNSLKNIEKSKIIEKDFVQF